MVVELETYSSCGERSHTPDPAASYDEDRKPSQVMPSQPLKRYSEEQEIDLELVAQLRALIKEEWERDARASELGDEATFSRAHYEEIMDERSPHTCWRYLAHKAGQLDEALELMRAALVWRKENGVDEDRSRELVKEFWFYTPTAFTGKDKHGEDVMYVVGRNYRKPAECLKPIIKLFCAQIMFAWDRQHRHDLAQFLMVFDVADTGYRNIDLDFMSWLVSVRDFLPNRISHIHVVGVPLIVRPLVRLIISWLPEHFRRLVDCGSFDELVATNIERHALPPEAGGTAYEAYLAPKDAPWLEEAAPVYQEPQVRKAIMESIWFHVTEERKARMHQMQRDHENSS